MYVTGSNLDIVFVIHSDETLKYEYEIRLGLTDPYNIHIEVYDTCTARLIMYKVIISVSINNYLNYCMISYINLFHYLHRKCI